MKKSYLNAVLTLTCLPGLGEGVRAQDARKIVANVPFEFVAGDAMLPAGTYAVGGGVSPEAPLGRVLIRSRDKGVLLLPIVFDGTPAGHRQFDFEHVDDKYFLNMVATRWSVHIFGTPRAITKVVQRKVPGALTSPGAN